MSGTGLRERKNAETQAAIERAAIELALSQGFEQTTVDEIAARANVSPRTVFGRYATKDAIVFGDQDEDIAAFEKWLDEAEGDLLDRVAGYLRQVIEEGDADELAHLRLQAMLTDRHLRRVFLGRLDILEGIISERLSKELGLEAGDVRVRMFGASTTGLLLAIAERGFEDPEKSVVLDEFERGLAYLRTGLDAISRG